MAEPTPTSPADGVTEKDIQVVERAAKLGKKSSGCLPIFGSIVLGAGLLYGGAFVVLGGKRIGPAPLWEKMNGYGLIGPSAGDVETVTHYKDGKEVKKYTVQKGLKAKILDFKDKRIQSKTDKELVTIDDVLSDIELMDKFSESPDYDISEEGFNRVNKWYQGKNYGSKMSSEGVE